MQLARASKDLSQNCGVKRYAGGFAAINLLWNGNEYNVLQKKGIVISNENIRQTKRAKLADTK
jgi:hypothetical protein